MGDFNNPNEFNNGQQPQNPNPDQLQYQQPQYQQPQYQQPQNDQPQQQPQFGGQSQYQQPNNPQPQYQQPQYGGQSQYQQPPFGGQPQYQPPKKKNGMAIASLACGIASFVLNCAIITVFLTIPAAIAGVILGIMAIKKPDIEKNDKTMAIVGTVLSGISILTGIILLVGCILLASSDPYYWY